MRIEEWNCQGAFRNKNTEIFELRPDILIVPECEKEDKLGFGHLTPRPNDFLWYGDTGKKGIGIFSYSDYKFKLLKDFNPRFRYVLPLEVSNGKTSFLLFAIWAMDNKQNPIASYIGQVWLAVNYYQSILTENSIVIGDFNSNQIWDEKTRAGNHTDVVNFLNDLGIESLYHKQFNETQGKESLRTFFMYRNLEKPYHIDYVFASQSIIKNGYKLTLGDSARWIDKSDHVPLILDLEPFDSVVSIQHTYAYSAQRMLIKLASITREKFKDECTAIRTLANELDTDFANEKLSIFVRSVENLKEIDRLTAQLSEIRDLDRRLHS